MGQVIELIGIYDDGSALDPTLPRNTATTIVFPRMADVEVYVDVFYNDGTRVNFKELDGFQKALFTVMNGLDPCQVLAEIQSTAAVVEGVEENNRLLFSIAPRDTRPMDLGRYVFDVWVIEETQRKQLVSLSGLVLKPNLVQG